MSTSVSPGELRTRFVVIGILSSVALFVCAGLLHYFPLTKVDDLTSNSEKALLNNAAATTTGGNTGTYWRRDAKILDTAALEATLVGAGFVLLVWSLNGRQFLKFSGAGFSFESTAVEKAAVALGDQKVAASLPAGGPAPANFTMSVKAENLPPSTALKVRGKTFDIFAPRDVPLEIVNAALADWPTGARKPRSLGDLTFGALNAGSEAPWLLGFQSGLIAVAGDHQGKPTVTLIA